MTYAEIRRELLNSARDTEYFRYGISKDTAAALLAVDRARDYRMSAEIAYINSIDIYFDAESRAQYLANANEYENIASLYSKYARENGAAYML